MMSSQTATATWRSAAISMLAYCALVGDLTAARAYFPRALERNLVHLGNFSLRHFQTDMLGEILGTVHNTNGLLFGNLHDTEADPRTSTMKTYLISIESLVRQLSDNIGDVTWDLQSPEVASDDGQALLFLLEESRIIEARARFMQEDEGSAHYGPASFARVRDSYQEWYTDALAMISDDETQRMFRSCFNGGILSPKIKDYLNEPRKPNLLKQGASAEASDMFSDWTFSFEQSFKRPFAEQILVIRELWKKERRQGAVSRNMVESRSVKNENLDEMVQQQAAFIAHGTSLVYLKLKDFLANRLGMQVLHFESEVHLTEGNLEVIEDYVSRSGVAFIVLTGDDKTVEGKARARQNVVHELGYLQGRLGRDRVIVARQKGVEPLSNLEGKQEIRFEGDSIETEFEKIRHYLEHLQLVRK